MIFVPPPFAADAILEAIDSKIADSFITKVFRSFDMVPVKKPLKDPPPL